MKFNAGVELIDDDAKNSLPIMDIKRLVLKKNLQTISQKIMMKYDVIFLCYYVYIRSLKNIYIYTYIQFSF